MRVVVAKKPYRGKPVGTGVDLSARDARVLIALGLMQRAVDAPVMVAEPVVEDEPEEAKPQKRAYRRRDMTAED